VRPVGIIGVPTSAGAFAPGQEQAPAALREAGIVARLRDAGADVRDHGDRERWRWRPDRARPRAQNLDQVVEIVSDTARRVGASIDAGETTLVLGGDCTVGIGTVTAHARAAGDVRLVYFDTHADLNVPGSVREGALDWMGMAHMLGISGAEPALVDAGPRLDPADVLLFGWGPEQATEFERRAVEDLGLGRIAVDEVAADPEGAAGRALRTAGEARVLVHFDVDVVDFTDTPLSENWGRNEGLPFATALRALVVLLGSPRISALTITELNPDHTEEGSSAIEELAGAVARGLAAG
jgi:arginase